MVAKRKHPEGENAGAPAAGGAPRRRVRRLKSQAWYWTPEWQAGQREAEDDIAAGRMEFFASGEEFLAALEEIHQQCRRTRGQSDSDANSNH